MEKTTIVGSNTTTSQASAEPSYMERFKTALLEDSIQEAIDILQEQDPEYEEAMEYLMYSLEHHQDLFDAAGLYGKIFGYIKDKDRPEKAVVEELKVPLVYAAHHLLPKVFKKIGEELGQYGDCIDFVNTLVQPEKETLWPIYGFAGYGYPQALQAAVTQGIERNRQKEAATIVKKVLKVYQRLVAPDGLGDPESSELYIEPEILDQLIKECESNATDLGKLVEQFPRQECLSSNYSDPSSPLEHPGNLSNYYFP